MLINQYFDRMPIVFKHIFGLLKIYQLKEKNKLSELWVFKVSNDQQIPS